MNMRKIINQLRKRPFRYTGKYVRIYSEFELNEEQIFYINYIVDYIMECKTYGGPNYIAQEIAYYIGEDEVAVEFFYHCHYKSIVKILKK